MGYTTCYASILNVDIPILSPVVASAGKQTVNIKYIIYKATEQFNAKGTGVSWPV